MQLPTSYEQYVIYFEQDFLTREDRFAAATDIMCGRPLPRPNYMVRNILVSHWGDSPQQHRALASSVYPLSSELVQSKYVGQSVIVTKDGHLPDIESDTKLANLTIEIGEVATAGLQYYFTSNRSQYPARADRIQPPFVGYSIGIPVIDRHSFSWDAVGQFTHNKPPYFLPTAGNQYDAIETHGGKIRIWPGNDSEYQRSRRAWNHCVTVGNRAAHVALERLVKRSDTDTQQRYQRLMRSGATKRTMSLPDLEALFVA
jgi:hypothetical protein